MCPQNEYPEGVPKFIESSGGWLWCCLILLILPRYFIRKKIVLTLCRSVACYEQSFVNGREALSNVIELAKRRKAKRFQIESSAFVVYHSNKLGRVVDISMDGLSFSHVERDGTPRKLRDLDIFLIDRDFYLEKVPLESDSVVKSYQPSFSSIYLGRYTVQFGELTRRQRSKIEYLIRNHTVAGG